LLSSNELAPLFKQLGLTTYESSIWQALLDKGEADARELIRSTGVPFGRVYDVLNGLIEKGVVEVQETRPKQYRPRRVNAVMDKLLLARRDQMDSEYKQLEEAAEAVKRRFAKLGQKLPKDEVFVSVALGEQDIQKLLMETIYQAEHEILIAVGNLEFATNISHLVDNAVQGLTNAATRGIRVRIIFSSDVAQVLMHFRNGREELNQRIQMRAYTGTLNWFKVVDNQYVFFELIDPFEPKRIAMVQLLSKKLAEHITQVFDRYWRDSRPLDAKSKTHRSQIHR
jgi:sugar-specific transcriptional regulator TrmB